MKIATLQLLGRYGQFLSDFGCFQDAESISDIFRIRKCSFNQEVAIFVLFFDTFWVHLADLGDHLDWTDCLFIWKKIVHRDSNCNLVLSISNDRNTTHGNTNQPNESPNIAIFYPESIRNGHSILNNPKKLSLRNISGFTLLATRLALDTVCWNR